MSRRRKSDVRRQGALSTSQRALSVRVLITSRVLSRSGQYEVRFVRYVAGRRGWTRELVRGEGSSVWPHAYATDFGGRRGWHRSLPSTHSPARRSSSAPAALPDSTRLVHAWFLSRSSGGLWLDVDHHPLLLPSFLPRLPSPPPRLPSPWSILPLPTPSTLRPPKSCPLLSVSSRDSTARTFLCTSRSPVCRSLPRRPCSRTLRRRRLASSLLLSLDWSRREYPVHMLPSSFL